MNRKWGVLGILLAVCLLALAVGGFAPVSYTHLTLPTN